jgi:hypothetical protein
MKREKTTLNQRTNDVKIQYNFLGLSVHFIARVFSSFRLHFVVQSPPQRTAIKIQCPLIAFYLEKEVVDTVYFIAQDNELFHSRRFNIYRRIGPASNYLGGSSSRSPVWRTTGTNISTGHRPKSIPHFRPKINISAVDVVLLFMID